jgi:hypothetical protein
MWHEADGTHPHVEQNTVTQDHKYSTMYVIGKDSARLQRPPASLTSTGRAQRNDTVSERTRQLVKLHAYHTCDESPCKRDVMSKQVDPRVWEHRQSLILTCTKDTLWSKFNETYPNLVWTCNNIPVITSQKHWYEGSGLVCHPNMMSFHTRTSRHMTFRTDTWNTRQSTDRIT